MKFRVSLTVRATVFVTSVSSMPVLTVMGQLMQTRINGPVPVTVNTGPELNVLGQVRGAADDHPVGVSPPARKLPETFVFVFSRPQINDRRLSALYTLRLSSIWLYGHTHTHPMHCHLLTHTYRPKQSLLVN